MDIMEFTALATEAIRRFGDLLNFARASQSYLDLGKVVRDYNSIELFSRSLNFTQLDPQKIQGFLMQIEGLKAQIKVEITRISGLVRASRVTTPPPPPPSPVVPEPLPIPSLPPSPLFPEPLPEPSPIPLSPVVPGGPPPIISDYSAYVRELDSLLAFALHAGPMDVGGIELKLDGLLAQISAEESRIPQQTMSEIVMRVEQIRERICIILEESAGLPTQPIPTFEPIIIPAPGGGELQTTLPLEPGGNINSRTNISPFSFTGDGEVLVTPDYFGQEVTGESGLPNLPEGWILQPGGQLITTGVTYYVEDQLVEPLPPEDEVPRGLPTYYPSPEILPPTPYGDTQWAQGLISKINSLIERMAVTLLGSLAWVDLEEMGMQLVGEADDLVALGDIQPEVKVELVMVTDKLYQRIVSAQASMSREVQERRPVETLLEEPLPEGTMPGNVIQPSDSERIDYFSLPEAFNVLTLTPAGGGTVSGWMWPSLDLEPERESTPGSILILSDAERMAAQGWDFLASVPPPSLPFEFVSTGGEVPAQGEESSPGLIALLALAALGLG